MKSDVIPRELAYHFCRCTAEPGSQLSSEIPPRGSRRRLAGLVDRHFANRPCIHSLYQPWMAKMGWKKKKAAPSDLSGHMAKVSSPRSPAAIWGK